MNVENKTLCQNSRNTLPMKKMSNQYTKDVKSRCPLDNQDGGLDGHSAIVSFSSFPGTRAVT